MRVLQVLTVFIVVAVLVECKGKGGAKGNKQKSNDEEKDPYANDPCAASKGEQKTARDRILSYMTIQEGSWELANATDPAKRRYTLDIDKYDYCMACEGVPVADPICKSVCYQTTDCYTTIYTNHEGETLVDKGCLYDLDDQLGCEEKIAECTENDKFDCTCQFCQAEYCNWDSSAMGLKLNSLLIAVYIFVL